MLLLVENALVPVKAVVIHELSDNSLLRLSVDIAVDDGGVNAVSVALGLLEKRNNLRLHLAENLINLFQSPVRIPAVHEHLERRLVRVDGIRNALLHLKLLLQIGLEALEVVVLLALVPSLSAVVVNAAQLLAELQRNQGCILIAVAQVAHHAAVDVALVLILVKVCEIRDQLLHLVVLNQLLGELAEVHFHIGGLVETGLRACMPLVAEHDIVRGLQHAKSHHDFADSLDIRIVIHLFLLLSWML